MLREPESRARISLADAPDFCIGSILVRPALRQVVHGEQRATLEPRVMQVLVALGTTPGQVVSRTILVERCWDGRVVGENAIQQVISRVRQLAATMGGFKLETINKVGYRLVLVEMSACSSAGATIDGGSDKFVAAAVPSRLPRRLFLSVAAMTAVGAVATAWRASGSDDENVTLARRLVAKGREAQLAGLIEQTRQSVAYLKRATELDPASAEAWGALALSYQNLMEGSDGPDLQELADWARAAARRALLLDGANVDAKAALATIRPNFRNWAANEPVLRDLIAMHPGQSVLEGALGWLLCDVGRWRDAIACFRRALALEPFQPLQQIVLAWGLWGGGELAEAELLLDSAGKLWPRHSVIWFTRFDFLSTTGSADAAVSLVKHVEARPVEVGQALLYDALLAFAAAMQSRTASDRAAAAMAISAAYERKQLNFHAYVTYCCALGLVDQAFTALEDLYLEGGKRAPGPLSRRKTSILFSAKGAALRGHERFGSLTRRLALDDYWRRTGTMPDIAV